MLDQGFGKLISGQNMKFFRCRRGYSTLEKVLFSAAALLLCASVVFGVLYVINKNRADSALETTAPVITTAAGTTKTDKTEAVSSDSETTMATQSTAAPTSAQTTPAAPTPTTAPVISNPANMYSSYANLVSFDPKIGWAEFDYFDLLKGADAVKYLVEEKGYTQADAQAEVDGYADSEFINKNENTQLRTVDMSAAEIEMVYLPDGTETTSWPDSDPMTYSNFKSFYAAHPDKILTASSFFYYITVKDGKITKVAQVFWP